MGWDCSALRLIPKSRQNQAEGQGSLCHRKTRGLLSQHSFQGPRAEDCRPRHWEQAATSHLKVDSFGNDCNSQARAYRVHLHSPPPNYHVHGGVGAVYAMAHMWRSEDLYEIGSLSTLICVLGIEFLCSETTCV